MKHEWNFRILYQMEIDVSEELYIVENCSE